MAQTITEKILARASGKSTVKPGDYLTIKSNCPIISGITRSTRSWTAGCT